MTQDNSVLGKFNRAFYKTRISYFDFMCYAIMSQLGWWSLLLVLPQAWASMTLEYYFCSNKQSEQVEVK